MQQRAKRRRKASSLSIHQTTSSFRSLSYFSKKKASSSSSSLNAIDGVDLTNMGPEEIEYGYNWTLDLVFTIIFAIFGPYVARVASAERAWEERLQKDRERREDEGEEPMSDLDFYAEAVKTYPSMYGPDGMIAKKEKMKKIMEEGHYEGDDDDEFMTDDDVEAFEEEFGVKYDPYYDEPYTEEELPADKKFIKEGAFGDRIYEDGEYFFKDGDMYYRRGSRPRMKFFWQRDKDAA